MTSTIGMIGFHILKPSPDDPLPFEPRLILTLDEVRTVAYLPNRPLLSTDLMTEKEIDDHVAALKQDLDVVASRAKRALREVRKPKN